jgi:flagellin-like protein
LDIKLGGRTTEALKMKIVWRDEEGVSPVIAVILMVAITVVLAAVLYVMVSGMLGSTNTTPTVSMNWIEDENNVGNYTGNIVRISGTKVLRVEDVTVTVNHDGNTQSTSLDILKGAPKLTIGTDFSLDYIDLNDDQKLGAEDNFVVVGGDDGDIIRLVYIPTGGQMGMAILK